MPATGGRPPNPKKQYLIAIGLLLSNQIQEIDTKDYGI
jgi:hypothetical protein